MDRNQLEMTKLKYAVKTWMMKAVTLMFSGENGNFSIPKPPFASPTRSAMKNILSPSSATFDAMQNNSSKVCEETLLKRPEVLEFINSVNASIQEKMESATPSPRKIRLSLGGFAKPMSPMKSMNRNNNLFSVKKTLYSNNSGNEGALSIETKDPLEDFDNHPIMVFPTTMKKGCGRESILVTSEMNVALEAANHLDETEQLVERMIDVSDSPLFSK
jgi:hypothetical protein